MQMIPIPFREITLLKIKRPFSPRVSLVRDTASARIGEFLEEESQ
jgi:hypothetical protein